MSDTKTDNRVPVTESPVLEVRTAEEFKSALDRIYRDGMPGFIIRSTGVEGIGSSHDDITDAVISILPGLDHRPGDSAEYAIDRTINDQILTTGEGLLHNDQRTDEDVNGLHIHRTKSGSGKVTLANAGTIHKGAFNNDDLSFLDREDRAEADLKEGLVDPEVVNPNIYSAHLEADDTVVFPLALPPSETHDKHGPVLHRFDTEVAPREVAINAVYPKK